MKLTPRPYQLAALDACDAHLRTKDTNPCIVLPTGAGKSLVIAWLIQRWKSDYPPFRCVILAHRKELVAQNAAELMGLWPGGDIGIYAAGLSSRDLDASITYAAIDSVYNRWGEFPPFDLILIDEAHRIPARGEGKYRSFIEGCRSVNPALRVVGLTATPFRLGAGPICHRDHVLHEVCYEANIGALIADGYLCRLRSKVGDYQPDMSKVRKNSGGDYVKKSLAAAVDTPELVRDTVRDAVSIMRSHNRRSAVFFCVDVNHCKDVSTELRRHGIEAPYVTGKTKRKERDRIAEGFKAGRFQALCNVNVYTEGFNAKRVDCVVLLRPTESKGLYMQMVGRGLRLHPDKTDCLVLDYARCIETHGPIDCLDTGRVRVIECGSVKGPEGWPDGCGDTFSRAVRTCPNCGWVIPPQEVEREEAAERKRKMHERRAANVSILGSEPETLKVDAVTVHRHRKPGKPDSMRVQYRCGLTVVKEWVCLDHPGRAGHEARNWWMRRFGADSAKTATVDSALDMLTGAAIADATESITVRRKGRHYDIMSHQLRDR